jgi:hypothetical protein
VYETLGPRGCWLGPVAPPRCIASRTCAYRARNGQRGWLRSKFCPNNGAVRNVNLPLLLAMVLAAPALRLAWAIDPSGPWAQSELTEEAMSMLTKKECMHKTIAYLKSGCADEACLKTLAGITGDCTTWAKGSIAAYCEAFDKDYLGRYCWTNELDARSCMFLSVSKSVTCKPGAQGSLR